VFLDGRDAKVGDKVALPWIFNKIGIKAGASVLDVGAGGFAGKNTTAFLQPLGCKICAVEIDKARSDALAETFPDIKVITADIRAYDYADGPFDLVIFDLDTIMTPQVMREFMPAAREHIVSDGYFITMLIYDVKETYDGKPPLLNPKNKKSQVDFMNEFYGSTRVGLEAAQQAVHSLGFNVVGVVDKFLNTHAHGNGVGWLVLQKS
jgi:cyclopropane fatty-acyl-phospholipid synthase-like methyltransferase